MACAAPWCGSCSGSGILGRLSSRERGCGPLRERPRGEVFAHGERAALPVAAGGAGLAAGPVYVTRASAMPHKAYGYTPQFSHSHCQLKGFDVAMIPEWHWHQAQSAVLAQAMLNRGAASNQNYTETTIQAKAATALDQIHAIGDKPQLPKVRQSNSRHPQGSAKQGSAKQGSASKVRQSKVCKARHSKAKLSKARFAKQGLQSKAQQKQHVVQLGRGKHTIAWTAAHYLPSTQSKAQRSQSRSTMRRIKEGCRLQGRHLQGPPS